MPYAITNAPTGRLANWKVSVPPPESVTGTLYSTNKKLVAVMLRIEDSAPDQLTKLLELLVPPVEVFGNWSYALPVLLLVKIALVPLGLIDVGLLFTDVIVAEVLVTFGMPRISSHGTLRLPAPLETLVTVTCC